METVLEIIISFLFIFVLGYLLFLIYLIHYDLPELEDECNNTEFRINCLDDNTSYKNYKWIRGNINGLDN
jgi:hypothetical protein